MFSFEIYNLKEIEYFIPSHVTIIINYWLKFVVNYYHALFDHVLVKFSKYIISLEINAIISNCRRTVSESGGKFVGDH